MSDFQRDLRVEISDRRPTWAEIDLAALASNFHAIRSRVGPEVKVMAVVKANAYGHGAVECARRLEKEGADWFGVALCEEGIELRNAGIRQPILSLAGFWRGQTSLCLQYNLVPVVYHLDMLQEFDRAAREAGIIADVHVKIDTGMGRLGVRHEHVREFASALKPFKNIRVDGLMTHFAAADEPSCEPLTEQQIQRFEDAVSVFRAHGYEPTYRHLANSAAIYSQRPALGNMVRPGGVLYGLWRDILPPLEEEIDLKPVMSLHSKIVLLKSVPAGETIGYGCTFEASRETFVATIPIGYEDGYLRGLSNRGQVVVRDAYAPIIGRISMDLTLIDVTNIAGVAVGDTVTLIGGAAGSGHGLLISAESLAKTVGTLSYEVTCRIGERVPRVFLSEN